MESAKIYRLNRDRITTNPAATTAKMLAPAAKPRLLDQVRQAIRTRHYSPKTEESYVHWIKRFILFHTNGTRPRWAKKMLRNFFQASPANCM